MSLGSGTYIDSVEQTNETEGSSETAALSASHTVSPPYSFSPSDIARLRIYRAAVSAGYYTDLCGTSKSVQHFPGLETTNFASTDSRRKFKSTR